MKHRASAYRSPLIFHFSRICVRINIHHENTHCESKIPIKPRVTVHHNKSPDPSHVMSTGKRKKDTASSGRTPVGQPWSSPIPSSFPLHHPSRHNQSFHPMCEPTFPIFTYPHIDSMPSAGQRNVRSDSDSDDIYFVNPDVGLHHNLSFLASFSQKIIMPPVDPNSCSDANGVLYDGRMVHAYNPNFLRTFSITESRVYPQFSGWITSIGIPSEIRFYNIPSKSKFRFGSIKVKDMSSFRADDLSSCQEALFPSRHGMKYFVDCRRAIRLVTYEWQKIPYEDIKANILRRIEVIRLLFEEHIDADSNNDKEARDKIRREIQEMVWFVSFELSVLNNLFDRSITNKHYISSLYLRVLVLSCEWYIGHSANGLPLGRPGQSDTLRLWDLPYFPDVSDIIYDSGHQPNCYPRRPRSSAFAG